MLVLHVCIVQHGQKVREPGDPGLSQLGHEHAIRTARHLSDDWDLLCASPLRRARETAAPIGDLCHLAVSIDERLRERMNWGDGPSDVDLPSFLADWERATQHRAWTPPSGDSSLATGNRMRMALESFRERGSSRVVVVSHGGATTDLLRTLFGDAAVETAAAGVIAKGNRELRDHLADLE